MTLVPLRDSTGCPPAELRARAAADGYLFVRDALPRAPLAALRRRIVAACAARGWVAGARSEAALRLGGASDARTVDLLQEVLATPQYRAVAARPEVARLLRTLWDDEPVPGVGDLCRVVSPGAADLATPPHQDAAWVRGDGVWTAWLPLGSCPLDLGPLAVLPGSHRRGVLPHDAERVLAPLDDATWAASALRTGDVVLFAATTIHRALPNRTAHRLRLSADFRFRPRRLAA